MIIHGDRVEALSCALVCATNYIRCAQGDGFEVACSMDEIDRMGQTIWKGGLFGYEKPEEVMTLLMMADAEGIHPAMAMR